MRKSSLGPLATLLTLAIVLALLAPATALAGAQDFTLVNRTGLRIVELYISTSETDEWEEDVLGVDVLEDGASVNIHFSAKEQAKHWDLKIVDSDGDEVVWTNLNLLEISKVTLHYQKGGQPVADLE
ncbi:MAG: hypothetical protein IPJ17_03225 [Holophagales bacterium]|nr:MAG: hypothetical protein IPJ17_03225 [Holophagales bacterium]